MMPETYNLTFITPCFFAGANQAVAELRTSAIRGQLRWWFRALGGAPEQECAVFGATAGDNGRASAVQVRADVVQHGPDWIPASMNAGPAVWTFTGAQNIPALAI